jgi:hypothetical protein
MQEYFLFLGKGIQEFKSGLYDHEQEPPSKEYYSRSLSKILILAIVQGGACFSS